LPAFASGVVELVVVHPFTERKFEWTDIPLCVKEYAEMRLHGPGEEDVYVTYGVNPNAGAAFVIRPDGYVGIICSLANILQLEEYLSSCLVKIV
jgi:phenol 2-monooxygenase